MSNVTSLMRWVGDGFANFVSGVGTSKDKTSGWQFSPTHLTQTEIDNMYSSDWLARKIVDIPAEDMTREWRTWQADQAEELYALETKLHVRTKVRQALEWMRLYGGSAILIGDGGSNPMVPLDLERFKKDGIKYLHVFSRHDLSPGDVIVDFNDPDYGKPEWYMIRNGRGVEMKVHRSRFAFFYGAQVPTGSSSPHAGWGIPILQIVHQAIVNALAAAMNTSALTEEAKLDIIKIPDLHQILATPDGEQRLIKRFALANTLKSSINTLLLGADEEFIRNQISFGGLEPIVLMQFQVAAGAADIPVTRLLGMSPAGLNSTGESDLQNYYDMIASKQADVQEMMERLDEALIRHALGDMPDDVKYEWMPLWQMSEKDKAEIASKKADAVSKYLATGLFMDEEFRPAVADMIIEDGFLPTLDQHMLSDDEWAAKAEEEAAAQAEQMQQQLEASGAGGNAPAPAKGGGGLKLIQGGKTDAIMDAEPRTLYVHRKVKNAAAIVSWAKEQGFATTLPASDLHVTVCYSRKPIDWFSVWPSGDYLQEIKIGKGGARQMAVFGDAVVLLFASTDLIFRHEAFEHAGASWDHEEYQPHITITYDKGSVDIGSIEAYQGEIILGPEIFEEIDPTWETKIEEE